MVNKIMLYAYYIFVYSYDEKKNTIINQSNFNNVYCYHQKSNALDKMLEIKKIHDQTNSIDRIDYHDLDCSISRIVTNQGYFFELTKLKFNDSLLLAEFSKKRKIR